MILELGLIALGVIGSFFLKDINFLGLNLDFLNSGLIYPDFLLIFIIFIALNKGSFAGIWIGFFAGLLEDSRLLSFSGSTGDFINIIGVHASVYSVAGFILGNLSRFLDKSSMLPQTAIVFVTTFLVQFLVWSIVGLLDDFNRAHSYFGQAVYNSVITPVWFSLLGWLYRFQMEDKS